MREELTEYYFREGCYITELSNTREDPELSVAHVRVEPGETTRWHKLLAITERYLILAGEGSVEVGAQPARLVREGDVVLIQPEVRQRITNTGTSDLIFLALCTPRFRESAYIDMQAGSDNKNENANSNENETGASR